LASNSANQFSLFDRVWPTALVVAALGLTVAWIAVLGYELLRLIGMAL